MEGAEKAITGKRSKSAWTREKEIRLIGLYQDWRLLWDRGYPDYNCVDRREYAMQAIADAMGNEFDVAKVKAKIKTLRDLFVREMKKEELSRTSSCPYISRWELFKCWEFLRGTVNIGASSQPAGAPAVSYPEVKREAPDEIPALPSYSGENEMILPCAPDSMSDEEGLGSPRSARLHSSISHGSPVKDFALGSATTGPSVTKEPHPPISDTLRAASTCPLPTKRLRQLTVPEHSPPGQESTVAFSTGSGGQLYETNTSPPGATSASSSAQMANRAGASAVNVVHLPFGDLRDTDALFVEEFISELKQMTEYQRDVAKVRIRQVWLDVKHTSQAPAVGTSK